MPRDALELELQLDRLIMQARADTQLPPLDRSRVAKLIVNHGQFLTLAPATLASIRGQRDVMQRLVKLVDDLLYLCYVDPHTRLQWPTLLQPPTPEPGRLTPAQRVRKALDELRTFRSLVSDDKTIT
jgi:hypothetical protein